MHFSDCVIRPRSSWQRNEGKDMKVSDLVMPYGEEQGKPDIVLLGVPLSRSSISPSAASEFPEAFRKSWSLFSTYYIDDNVDTRDVSIVDAGDVVMHGTDIIRCHTNIEQAMGDVMERFPESLYISIGGDHSISAPIVRAHAKEGKRMGILQFDTHLDLRNVEDNGPSNGTPIRQLLDGGVIRGEDVYNIGLHGFYNAPSLIEAADHYGVNRINLKEFRKKGAEQQIAEVMAELQKKTDAVYVTVDMDVLDIAYAPGVPASTPGGMRTDELFELLYEVGKYPIAGLDFVCIDPHRDTNVGTTVKAVTYAWLTFVASRYQAVKAGRF